MLGEIVLNCSVVRLNGSALADKINGGNDSTAVADHSTDARIGNAVGVHPDRDNVTGLRTVDIEIFRFLIHRACGCITESILAAVLQGKRNGIAAGLVAARIALKRNICFLDIGTLKDDIAARNDGS